MEQNGKYNFNEALPEIEMPLSPKSQRKRTQGQAAACAVGNLRRMPRNDFPCQNGGKDAFSALCNAAKETVYRTVSLDEVKSALSSKISEKEQVTNGENYVTPAAPKAKQTPSKRIFSENAPISPQSEVQSQTRRKQSAKPASAVTLNFQKQEQETSVKDITLPVSGEITSDFGSRIHPIYGTNLLHGGIDIGVETGTPVKAALRDGQGSG